jgi:hypothetical protein
MRFLWCAVPGPLTASSQPAAVVLTVAMAGPFASRAAAAEAQPTLSRGTSISNMPSTSPTPAAGSLVASPRSLQIDTWTAIDQTATISLPTTLTPGFYLFVTTERIALDTSSGGQGGSDSSGIVQVTPT